MSKFPYKFKYFYKDGTNEISSACGNNPLLLFNDFDGLMDWEEFDKLTEKNMTTKKILKMAMKVYKGFLKDYYRIEIINDDTKEVIDYIEEGR